MASDLLVSALSASTRGRTIIDRVYGSGDDLKRLLVVPGALTPDDVDLAVQQSREQRVPVDVWSLGEFFRLPQLLPNYVPHLPQDLMPKSVNLPTSTAIVSALIVPAIIGPLDALLLDPTAHIPPAYVPHKIAAMRAACQQLRGDPSPLAAITTMASEAPREALRAIRRLGFHLLRTCVQSEAGVRLSHAPTPLSQAPYLREIQARLGSNLRAVVLYGSAVYSDSPSDIDAWVVVEDCDRAYESLTGVCLADAGIPVHLSILPADMATQYIRASSDISLQPEQLRIVYGSIEIPIVDSATLTQLSWSRALSNVHRARSIVLNQLHGDGAQLLQSANTTGNTAFFKLLVATPATLLVRAYLNDRGELPETKHAIAQMLGFLGYRLPEYRPCPHYLSAVLKESIASQSHLCLQLLTSASPVPI